MVVVGDVHGTVACDGLLILSARSMERNDLKNFFMRPIIYGVRERFGSFILIARLLLMHLSCPLRN